MQLINNFKEFHVLTEGFDFYMLERLLHPIEAASGLAFSHILHPSLDRRALSKCPDTKNYYCLREDVRMKLPPPKMEKLAELEQPGVPTIHSMIMSDRVVRSLDYTEALSYTSYLADRYEQLFRQIKPSVIISGMDSLHASVAMAVARKTGFPWYAFSFTTIPTGLTGFCAGMNPSTIIAIRSAPAAELQELAETTIREFEERHLVVPAYLSANNVGMIIKRFPRHIRALCGAVNRAITGRFDKFTYPTTCRSAREYVRKRRNLLFLPKSWFVTAPPVTPYLFIGLHKQPETAIDVWAPFFSNQISVIEAISRSTPPTHPILVKLHKSDADNYSREQLDHLRRLPGVQLVSPFVHSRPFIENASLVLAIQGNIALEAALLGRPVLMFGDSRFMELPSVSRVNRIPDLPTQIRSKLAEERPSREEIVRGFMSYLSCYTPGCYNNWDVSPSAKEIEKLGRLFQTLREFVEKSGQCVGC